MKKNSLSLKTLASLIFFSVIIILILWIVLIKMLGVSYEKYQIKNIKNIAKSIKNTDSNNLSTELENYAYLNGICIQYISNEESTYYNDKNPTCIIDNNDHRVFEYKSELINSDTDYIKIVSPNNGFKSIIYKISLPNNEYIFLNTSLEDITEATNVFKSEFIYIVIILIILSVTISFILSKKINEPIINLTKQAKELSKGNYDVKFMKSNIAEIDELSDVLTVAASEMNKTDELRRDLIANVSHDLKTPLTMIKAYAEMVRDLPSDEEKKKQNLNIIIEETDRLNYLVNDLLDLSKIESGNSPLNVEEFDIVEEINNIMNRYQYKKETENYNFELKIPDKKIMVKADKSKIGQVIYNLVNNAIEHTGDDLKVIVELKNQKDLITINITDTGKGISEEEKALVWNKYYTKGKNHKRNGVGSGIGLSIVKNVLEQHNYEYGIDSKLGEYTTFYFKMFKSK